MGAQKKIKNRDYSGTGWQKTRFPGVRFRCHAIRKFRGHPEKYFCIRYQSGGRTVDEGLGWESEGFTASRAFNIRSEIIGNRKTGEGPQSFNEIKTEKHEPEGLTFDDLYNFYIGIAKTYKSSWKDDESRYNRHLKNCLGPVPASKITPDTLLNLKEKIQKSRVNKRTIRPGTVKQILFLIRAVFNKGINHKKIPGPNPFTATTAIEPQFNKFPKTRRYRFLSKNEVNTLLPALKNRSVTVYFQTKLSFITGMRMGEILSCRREDFHGANNQIQIYDSKGNEDRIVHVDPDFANDLLNFCPKKGLLFPCRNGKIANRISDTYKRTVKELGLNDGVTNPLNKVVFHTARHTFASWLAIAGESLFVIQKLLGHKSPEQTQIYAHLCPEQKGAAGKSVWAQIDE
ncbi:hypothetical protein UR09_02915 [Candidatus Nitromaritima sp. SCGC AAA799-A02]|nr:hypothetical protein UR09_02915 [Candidatus Nitromaritima sp. SCGC AAA799-A02]